MRITFLLAGGFNLAGGHRVIAIYSERLMRRGHEVLVVSRPDRRPSLRDRARALRRGEWLPLRKHPPPSHFDRTAVPRRELECYRSIVAADLPDADITIATWWETAEWLAELPRSKGAKALFVQGYEAFDHTPKDRVDGVWRLPFHKIAVSHWLARLAAERFDDTDVTIVPNSVDPEQFHAPPRGKQPVPTIGYLHHSAPLKGGPTAMEAIRLVSAQLPSLRLRTFGEPAFSEPLPGNVDHMHWRDPPQDAIRGIYAQCDAWLTASTSEGFSLPTLEAMACRSPVVATRSGGPEDLVRDGENGFLARVGDASALANRLLTILNASNEEWRRMSDAALATATGYSWEDATDLFEAGLKRTIERARVAAPV